MASYSKRASKDLKDLTDYGFRVMNEDLTGPPDNLKCFAVRIHGPKDTP
jgi:ubiquitin-conjugating enzyme E2 H